MSHRPALRVITAMLLAMAIALSGTGCGAKGDLYLPKQPAEQR